MNKQKSKNTKLAGTNQDSRDSRGPRLVPRPPKKYSPGRPHKYTKLLSDLEDDELYTPASIARFAEENGYITSKDPDQIRQELQRIRITMGRYSNNHGFPDEGDGNVLLSGQAPTPGWFGWRWKEPLYERKKKMERRNIQK